MVAHCLHGLAQEAIGRAGVPAIQQHEVDQPPVLVDGTEQVLPLAADPRIGLVYPLRSRARLLVRSDTLLDLGRIALHPTKEGKGIDRNAALGHHFSQITITDAIFAISAHAQQDNLNWKAAALEQGQQGGTSISRPLHILPRLMQRCPFGSDALVRSFVSMLSLERSLCENKDTAK